MNTIYDQIIAQHLALQEALADNPDSVELETVQALILQARKAGANVADIAQRDQLRQVLRQWGAFVYERTGEYPPIQLAPVSEPEVEGVLLGASRWKQNAGFTAAIIFVLVAGVLIGRSLLTKSTHTPTLTPTLTPTNTPQPTSTPDLTATTEQALFWTLIAPTSTGTPTPTPTNTPTPMPTPPPLAVYTDEGFSRSYGLGVDASDGRVDWVSDMNGYMCMDHPSGRSWGTVYITVGPPTLAPRPGRDMSGYQTLSFELRGEAGGEYVFVGLKDNADRDDGTETKIRVSNLTTEWQTFTLPLSEFITADLTRLYVVTEFVFELHTPAETVCFRHIQYLP
jgi:hypothetical protein